jgi:putative aminopeptidase FrvX
LVVSQRAGRGTFAGRDDFRLQIRPSLAIILDVTFAAPGVPAINLSQWARDYPGWGPTHTRYYTGIQKLCERLEIPVVAGLCRGRSSTDADALKMTGKASSLVIGLLCVITQPVEIISLKDIDAPEG